ncbi:hypothetical protein CERSUDRAFT_96116 [Gelatoporia subvermispora B]|uniref:Hydrophobin n=1 Tax=Ceriporiopsis subvermispora (strain B) TaxID=914234 RepID=M2RAT5_CERS8|nr:hypothetical protein CERSUDRAFT_96116 [Gelatoporia subvermispora B]
MFALKPFLALTALALAALAIPAPQDDGSSQCDPDSLYCCDATSSGNSTYMRAVGSALKMDLVDDKMYATGCSSANPVNVGGGVSCSSIPVCCEGNSFGLIGIGCASIPVNV